MSNAYSIGIWSIIKGWLDPVVAGKVHFTNNHDELTRYIPAEHLITELGGSDPWSYSYVEPVAGENKMMSETATRDKLLGERAEVVREFEAATIQWLKSGVGEESNKEVVSKRDSIAEKLRTGYWTLDPYVRARSYYDRTGVIKAGGKVSFYNVEEKKDIPAPAPSADDLD